jgi:hypothetical protein
LELVGKQEDKDILAKDIEREATRPSPDDANFVEQNVAWSLEGILQRRDKLAEVREFLGKAEELELTQGETTALLTHFSNALQAHHRSDSGTCLEQLRLARDAAKSLQDSDLRITESLSVACLAHQFDEDALAREILLDVTRDPESDNFYLLLSGMKLMDVVTAVLRDDQLKPLVERWKADEIATEIVACAHSLAKREAFARVDSLYRQLDDTLQRLLVCNAVIEQLQQPAR